MSSNTRNAIKTSIVPWLLGQSCKHPLLATDEYSYVQFKCTISSSPCEKLEYSTHPFIADNGSSLYVPVVVKKKKRFYLGDAYPEIYFTYQEARYMFYSLKGLINREIADKMKLSVKTLKFYSGRMGSRLKCHSKRALINLVEKTDFLKYVPYLEAQEEKFINKEKQHSKNTTDNQLQELLNRLEDKTSRSLYWTSNKNSSICLTRQQTRCLICFLAGMKNKNIAEKLNISPATVYVHSASIRRKMGCDNRREMITVAKDVNFIENLLNSVAESNKPH